jgi:hypothetical protein
MQARRASLYVKKKTPSFFYDTVGGMVDGADLIGRTPSIFGDSYVAETGTAIFNEKYVQIAGVGIGNKSVKNIGSYSAVYLIPEASNPYPIQGHMGITVTNIHRKMGARAYSSYIAMRCGNPPSMSNPFIRCYFVQRSGSTTQSSFIFQYHNGHTSTIVGTHHTAAADTGRVRMETELIGTTMRVAVAAPSIGVAFGPKSYNAAGTAFLNRSNVGLLSGNTSSSVNNSVIDYPVIVDDARELLV